MAEQKSATPAYVPFKTFTAVLDSFKSFLPDKIDPTRWTSYSGGMKSELMGALRFLGLIDDKAVPTEALMALANADVEHRPARFKNVMKAAYPGLMSLDLTKATPGSFDAEVRKLGQEGDIHGKAASFFLESAKWVGVPLSPLLMRKGSLSGSQRKRPTNGTSNGAKPKVASATDHGTGRTISSTGPVFSIALERGITLKLSASADTFQMAPEDRSFVMELISLFENHSSVYDADDEDWDEEN